MKIVAILNHKGGVGKTTFTGCTAQALALSGFRVLTVDNDSQHNLSTLLGVGSCSPSIRDVYRCSNTKGPETFLHAIRKTELDDLHIVTSEYELLESDVFDVNSLHRSMVACRLERFYDIVLIDNGPGLGTIQIAAVLASDEIFVPTELKQFAVNGIAELEAFLDKRYPGKARITKIIPNYYKDTKRSNTYIEALNTLFPGRITATAIPVDGVFDEMVTEQKILFLHRLYSRGAAYFLKVIHELFDLSEDEVWDTMIERRRERMSREARERFYQRHGHVEKDGEKE